MSRRALGLLDRLAHHNRDPLVALSVLAGATSRIRVQTEVLPAALRDTALLAKQAATLDRMTGGRLVLGLGVGGRETTTWPPGPTGAPGGGAWTRRWR